MRSIHRLLLAALLALVATAAAAGNLTNYYEDAVIDASFRGGTFSPPATWYIATVTAITDAEAGTVTETACGLGRASVANSAAQWDATVGGNGTTANTNTITYSAPTSDCGQVVGVVFYDASSAGNAWIVVSLTTPKTVNNGDDAPSFAAGALTFQIDN